MSKPIKLLEEVNMNITNEQKMQREDAKKELFSYQELVTITPPDWMPASAISEWDRLVPIMKKEFPLSETDYGLLISYCLAFSRIKTAEGEIRKINIKTIAVLITQCLPFTPFQQVIIILMMTCWNKRLNLNYAEPN